MSYLRQPARVTILAWNQGTGTPQTGDALNITGKLSKNCGAAEDLGNPTELDSVNFPGVYYYSLSNTQRDADHLTIAAQSTTVDVSIAPRFFEAVREQVNVVSMEDAVITASKIAAQAFAGDCLTVDGKTLAQAFSLICAVLLGQSSGFPNNPVFRSMNGVANRVVAQTDGEGNRTTVGLNPT